MIVPVVSITIILIYIIELTLEAYWIEAIFTNGITIYSKEYSFMKLPSIDEMKEANRSKWMQPIIFYKSSINNIFFRESILPEYYISSPNLMRGIIIINEIEKTFKVKGVINYRSCFIFLLVFAGVTWKLFNRDIISLLFFPLSF